MISPDITHFQFFSNDLARKACFDSKSNDFTSQNAILITLDETH